MTADDYNQLVDNHADGLFRFMLKKAEDHQLAQDLVQESFEKVWLKKDEVEAAKAKSYLFSTAFHAFIDHTRRAKKFVDKSVKKETTLEHTTSRAVNPDLKSVLEEALSRLPDIQKTVVLLRDYEGYNYQEIARVTDLTESQVKVYIFRARKALKKYLVSVDLII